MAALVAILIGFATRTLNLRALVDSLLETIWTTGMLFFIVIGAFLFAYFIALTRLPNAVAEWGHGLQVAPWVVILMMIGFYIVLGCFLDAISMILITVPVFLPLAESLGIDPIWFGILVLVVVEVGMITPPVGLNIFVIRAQMPDIALADVLLGDRAFPCRRGRPDRPADAVPRDRAMAAQPPVLTVEWNPAAMEPGTGRRRRGAVKRLHDPVVPACYSGPFMAPYRKSWRRTESAAQIRDKVSHFGNFHFRIV